ncbi:amidohydrolase family protein [Rhodococcus sp. NPDC055024]
MSALLIENGFVYSADAENSVLPSTSVLAVNGHIVAVGPAADVAAAADLLPSDVRDTLRRIDARSMMVLPGLVNGHWHDMYAMTVPQKLLLAPSDRGDALNMFANGGDIPAVTMMFDSLDNLIEQMTPDEAYAIAQYSMWQQLRGGVTTLADTGSLGRPEAMVAAARDLGIRYSATTWAADAVCPPGADTFLRTRDTDAVLARIEDLVRLCAGDTSGRIRCRPSIAYITNMTDELGAGFAELVARHGTGLATHVGALANESDGVLHYYGATGIRRQEALGLMTDSTVAAHCSFMDDEEEAIIRGRGVHICHSPASYGPSGVSSVTGTGVVPRLHRDGHEVSLSTDATPGPQAGMLEAMRAAWQMYNEAEVDNTVVRATDALAMSTRTAANGLGWADEIGSIEVGKKADLTLVRVDDWRFELSARPLESLLWLGGSHDVDTVIVDGEVLISGKETAVVDLDAVRSRCFDAIGSFSSRCLGIPSDVVNGVLDAGVRHNDFEGV